MELALDTKPPKKIKIKIKLGHTRANEKRVRNTIITMMSSKMHGPWIAFNCGYNSRSMIHIGIWGF
jgi:hypothetical protein